MGEFIAACSYPVEWYAWGEEAFVKAKTEDKPVFQAQATVPVTGGR